MQLDDVLALFGGGGYGATKFGWSKGSMIIRAAETWNDSSQGAYVGFETTKNGTTSRIERMRITDDGKVGIGTSNPTRAKVEISGVSGSFAYGKRADLTIDGFGTGTNTGTVADASLYATGEIWALAFFAFSDERIKRIEGRSDAARDLATLQSIEVTDFSYIDTVVKGTGKHKKIIAQQVEKVFPQAVSRSADVVPDIYKTATVTDGWINLTTDLKIGERVRLIGEKTEGIHEVLETAEGRFRTDFAADGDTVFVFGREVKDFLNVDYDAIAMLNVSATQQIKKEKDAEVNALQAENADLHSQTGLARKSRSPHSKPDSRSSKPCSDACRITSPSHPHHLHDLV